MFDARKFLNLGQNAMVRKVVESEDTAGEEYPDLSRFLSTHTIIDMAILASVQAIDQYLPDAYISIGYSTSFTHSDATVLGMTVVVKVVIIDLTGNEVDLRIEAWDEQGEIGHGIHKRRIVQRETLYEKAEQRARFLNNHRVDF